MVIHQNKLATTFFFEEEKILHSEYAGRVIIDLAFNHLVQIVNFYRANEVLGSVIDLSKLHGSFARVFEYLNDSYYPSAVASGLRCQAFVVSEDLMIANLGFRLTNLAEKFNVNSMVCTDRKEANDWVKRNVALS